MYNNPPPNSKVIVDPTTGKMKTVEVPSTDLLQKKLAEEHKELRDMLDGNKQFHEDPYKAPEKVDHKLDDTDDSSGIPEYIYHGY